MIRTILSIASAVLLIAGSGALVGFSVERESNARYTGLEVDVVEIDGMFFVDAAGVRDHIFANDSISGTFVADLSLHDVERWVREIPAIDGVEMYPGLNRTLHVQVTQRKPLARVHTSEDEPDFYIDSEGTQLPLSPYYTAGSRSFTRLHSRPRLKHLLWSRPPQTTRFGRPSSTRLKSTASARSMWCLGLERTHCFWRRPAT